MSDIKNIVLLVADQQRRDCLGAYGNPVVETPTIDELADNGLRFDNAFTPCAICTPARACIQTGQLPTRYDMIFNPEFQRLRGGELDLPENTPFFASDLKAAGWNLAHHGKWHIGKNCRPSDYGYEGEFHPGYGFPSKHPHYLDYLKSLGLSGFELENPVDHPNGSNWHQYAAEQVGGREASVPAYLAEQTINSIRKFAAEGPPFLAATHFWGPHYPYRIPAEYLNMYMDRLDQIELWPNARTDLEGKPEVLRVQGEGIFQTDWMDDTALKQMIARYYGYVTLIDHEIGRIIQTLKDEGVYEETLILYFSDHGSALGSHGMWDKGFGMYDCFFRIPLIASHPSIQPGTCDAIVDLCDLAPTFREIGGCRPAPECDGSSLVPLLQGNTSVLGKDSYCAMHWGHQFPFWQRMIRTDKAKYIWNVTDRDEYYDLEGDPGETTNIIDQVDDELLTKLRVRLCDWLQETDDPLRGAAPKLLGVFGHLA